MSPEQIRAACGLLKLTQTDLSNEANIPRSSLHKYDLGELKFNQRSLNKLEDFFKNNNIIFLENNGVMFKPKQEILKLEGHFGFVAFMNDVYEVTKSQGGEICVSNVDERNWIKWMTHPIYEKHSKRMSKLDNFILKIFIEEGNDFCIASEIAEYRYIPTKYFNDQSFYVYGDKLALIYFGDEVKINIINSASWADSFRKLFNYAWLKSKAITKV